MYAKFVEISAHIVLCTLALLHIPGSDQMKGLAYAAIAAALAASVFRHLRRPPHRPRPPPGGGQPPRRPPPVPLAVPV